MRVEGSEFGFQRVGLRVERVGFSVKKCRTRKEKGFGFRVSGSGV